MSLRSPSCFSTKVVWPVPSSRETPVQGPSFSPSAAWAARLESSDRWAPLWQTPPPEPAGFGLKGWSWQIQVKPWQKKSRCIPQSTAVVHAMLKNPRPASQRHALPGPGWHSNARSQAVQTSILRSPVSETGTVRGEIGRGSKGGGQGQTRIPVSTKPSVGFSDMIFVKRANTLHRGNAPSSQKGSLKLWKVK